MFKNDFLFGFRHHGRSKIFMLINIAGLAIGISAFLVIFLIGYYKPGFTGFSGL